MIRTALAAAAAFAMFAVQSEAVAIEDYLRAIGEGATSVTLCASAGAAKDAASPGCDAAASAAMSGRLDQAFAAALAKADARTTPLLKRDQVWAREMIESFDPNLLEGDGEVGGRVRTMIERRIEALDAIGQGLGRSGAGGRWVNAFGSIDVGAETDGAREVTIHTVGMYGSADEQRHTCEASAVVRRGEDGWQAGPLTVAAVSDDTAPGDDGAGNAEPAPQGHVKIIRQGETLRVVAFWPSGQPTREQAAFGCSHQNQITGTYFPSGGALAEPSSSERDTSAFTAPTFGCEKPETASEEEICSDPELAENDQRLNRAWKAVLSKLDAKTRRLLIEDERGYADAQALQYPEFLHPAWMKQSADEHYTADARDRLDSLQRERIALLEGFDLDRKGIEGVWLAHDAVIDVKRAADGTVTAKGWKWDQGDWKAGCEYEMTGHIEAGRFVSGDNRTNPDTLERDGATLIVNGQDDEWAGKRQYDDPDDEPKCRRSVANSSSARLFPAKPSPDINPVSLTLR